MYKLNQIHPSINGTMNQQMLKTTKYRKFIFRHILFYRKGKKNFFKSDTKSLQI